MQQRIRFFLWLVGILAGCALPAAADDGLGLEVHGIYWLPTLSGDGAVGVEGVEGTDFDLEDDFGYGDREGIPGVRVAVGRTHRLVGELLLLDVSADNQIDRSIRFEDILFRVNTEVSSELEALLGRLYYQLTLGRERTHLGLILGGQYIDLEARAEAEQFGRASASLQAGLPFIGAAIQAAPHEYLDVSAVAVGSRWDIEDVETTFFDLRAGVGTRWRALVLAAGYRYLLIDAEDTDVPIRADLTFSGPVLYGGFSW